MKTNYTIHSTEIKNIPWEEKPENCNDVLWRSSKNPIIQRDLLPTSNSIFNSAVVPFEGNFAGVFRCDDKRRYMRIHAGKSVDGYSWDINYEPIRFEKDSNLEAELKFDYAYDPRVCWIEDRFYLTWCNGLNGYPTIGLAYTHDFVKYYQMENAFLPFNRNGVLFPRIINGKYVMLSRPSDNGHTPFGDIFLSQSPDLRYWGDHRFVMGTNKEGWQSTKIGAGPIPIETSEGWLVIYHGVLTSCNGFVYHMGGALLDLEKPWIILHRSESYIMSPKKDYECIGDVPNVVFPCAALVDAPTGRMAIYYGAADTVTGVAYGNTDELIDFIKSN